MVDHVEVAQERFQMKDYQSAIEHLDVALEEFKQEKAEEYLPTLHMMLHILVLEANNTRDRTLYKRALEVGTETRDLYQKAGEKNSVNYCKVLRDLASNYSNFGKAAEAIETWKEARALQKSLHFDKDLDHAVTCKGLAEGHIAIKEYAFALDALNEAVKILLDRKQERGKAQKKTEKTEREEKEENEEELLLATCLMKQGQCMFRCGQQGEAIETFDRGMKLYRARGGNVKTSLFASMLWAFQGMLMENKAYEKSISMGQEALETLRELGLEDSNRAFVEDTINRLNFCIKQLNDPARPLVPLPPKKEKKKKYADIDDVSCAYCGVKGKKAIDEPDRDVGPVTFKKCGRCKKERYCSEACQKKHWKVHQKTCVAPEKKK